MLQLVSDHVSNLSPQSSVLFCAPGVTLPDGLEQRLAIEHFHIEGESAERLPRRKNSIGVPIGEAASMALALNAARSIPAEIDIGGGVWLCFRQAAQTDDDGHFNICVQRSKDAQIVDCEPSRIEAFRDILSNIPFPRATWFTT